MPRYVSKEDVKKGLVNPNIALDKQPEYMQAIAKEAEEKKKFYQDIVNKQKEASAAWTKQKRQAKTENSQKGKGNLEGEHNGQENVEDKHKSKWKPKRGGKGEKSKYNWSRKDVTEDTVVPNLPKTILQKPDDEKFNIKVNNLVQKKKELVEERNKLNIEERQIIRLINESKATGKVVLGEFSNAKKELLPEYQRMQIELKELKKVKEQTIAQLNDIQANLKKLQPKGKASQSHQGLKKEIAQLQQRLTSENLEGKEEQRIRNSINLLKRQLPNAKMQIDIQTQIEKLQELKELKWKQKKQLLAEMNEKYANIEKLRAQLTSIDEKKKQEFETLEPKQMQEVKAEYEAKCKVIEEKRGAIKAELDKAHEQFYDEKDKYEEQQELLRYIKMVQEGKKYIAEEKIKEEKRKKEREEYEARKKKEEAQRQRIREEKRLYREEKERKEAERRERLLKQREIYINQNPNHEQMSICGFLIGYCESLRPKEKKQFGKESKNPELHISHEWDKELKKGAQIVMSKKANQDQEVPQKAKKEKKKQEKEDNFFIHRFQVVKRFEQIKVLSPSNVAEIDQAIQQLKDKMVIYSLPNEEQIEEFKRKAGQDFDIKHGLTTSKKGKYKEKTGKEDQKDTTEDRNTKTGKTKFSQQDFPEIN